MNLPAAFEEKMRALLGDEFDEYIACYEEPRYYGMRVNTGKISAEEFEKICPFEIRKIPWIENGFYYDGDKVSPAKHPYYFAGLYYLQEPQSELRPVMVEAYKEVYGKEPEICIIHGGLECGIFLGKRPDLDCVSCGPDVLDIHSYNERLDIASTQRSWEFLKLVLKNCK